MFGLFKKKSSTKAPKLSVAEFAAQATAVVVVAAELIPDPSAKGRSRLGGGPAVLPIGMPWPDYGGEPMLLVAQVDLQEAVASVPELKERFPDSGVLQVFVDKEAEWCSETEPTEDGPLRVFLHSDRELRQAVGPALPEKGSGIRFVARATLPDSFWLRLDSTAYETMRSTYPVIVHQLGGWANPIQNEPAEEGRVLVLQLSVEDADDLYITADPEALRLGRLTNARVDVQFD